MEQSEESIDL